MSPRAPRSALPGWPWALALLLAACAMPPGPADAPGRSPAAAGAGDPLPTIQLLDAARLPRFEGERQVLDPAPKAAAKVDRTVAHGDLWERVRQGFGMPDLDNALVRERTAWYAANPEYLKRVFERSRMYLYYIVEEIEKRGMPTELALLPMVESAFNPMAYSRAHASGLWQFIPDTGRRYELKQNWWFDERRDIVASTGAALDYLRDLYERHGDWQLALASYNWGGTSVARAIEKNRAEGLPTDYASLRMPPETQGYVPKLQAFKNIISSPEAFGIALEPIPNQPYFTTITKEKNIDVVRAAKLAEMPLAEFVALNPGFSRPLINVSVSPRIVLPADRVEIFHANLEKLDEKHLVSWQTYRPKQGENLEAIARKFNVPLSSLKEVNGVGPRSRTVPPLIVVPTSGTTIAKLPIMYSPPVVAPATRRVAHVVRKGETLSSIARRYGVRVEDLRRWNPKLQLVTGQKLIVEVRAPSKSRSASKQAAKGKPREAPKPKPYRQASS